MSRPPTWRRVLATCAFLAVPIFPIPGLSGRAVSSGGVARTNSGGAVIAGTVTNAGTSRLAITRLLVDGTVDLGYGTRGISSPPVGTGARATALAINPATGEAWVGVLTASGASEIVALDGSGNPVPGFGQRGIVRLSGTPSGVEAVAWRSGQLLVAAGRSPCGCQVARLDASTGRSESLLRFNTLTPCPVRSITSAVFATGGNALFGTSARCSAPILALRNPISRTVQGARAVTLAGSGANICAAATMPDRTALGPYAVARDGRALAGAAPAGRLVALDSLQGGACAALIYPTGAHNAVVVQSAPTGRHTTTTALPGALQPLGMSRCNHHLLVIGDEPSNGLRNAVVAVVPVHEGPHASAASARCTAAH
jgi:hypothetical protein